MKRPQEKSPYKVARVAMVGRPNVGKSTLLNALLKQKISIVSPKPQTTRSQLEAVYEDERGQLFFVDTPGYFISRKQASQYNSHIRESLKQADIVVFIVDQTRVWGREDESVWHLIQESGKPILVVINKLDETGRDFSSEYEALLSEEATEVIRLSALKHTHVPQLLHTLFTLAPVGKRDPLVDQFVSPLLSQSGSQFLAELIREKLFIHLKEEVPYQLRPVVEDTHETDNHFSLQATIFTPSKRYKPIIIGKNGQMIAKIRKAVEKELAVVTGKKVSATLMVEEEE